jgi:hypothetical protein
MANTPDDKTPATTPETTKELLEELKSKESAAGRDSMIGKQQAESAKLQASRFEQQEFERRRQELEQEKFKEELALENASRREKKRNFEHTKTLWQKAMIALPVVGIIFLTFIGYMTMAHRMFIGLWVFSAFLLLALLFSFVFVRGELNKYDTELEDIQFETEITAMLSAGEKRAERSFRANEGRLRRYYDLNINQNKWVFFLGVGCIVCGFTVVFVTLKMLPSQPPDNKLYVAVIGGVGSLLADFVAVLFVQMHSSAAKVLGRFHYRLVRTHQLLLGHLIASRIGDTQLGKETMAHLSLAIFEAERKKAHEQGADRAPTH